LQEEEAEFGSGFGDELAVARGVGGIVEGDEPVGDFTAAAREVGGAGVEGLGRGLRKAPPSFDSGASLQ
jgi:hypothetical protein